MKKLKKLEALVLAFTAMFTCLSSVTANAEEQNALAPVSKTAKAEQQVMELVRDGDIDQRDAERLIEKIDEISSSNTTYTFPSYTSLPTNFAALNGEMCDTYVAFFTNSTLNSTYFRFLVNNNIGTTNPAVFSNYKKFYSNVSLANLQNLSSEDTAEGKCYSIYLGTSGSLSTNKNVFSLNLGHSFSNIVTAPSVLRDNIRNKNNTLVNSFPTQTSTNLSMGLYTVGDLTRNGVIDDTDYDYLMAYIVEILESNGSKNEEIFKLAGDVNNDKSVDITDVIALGNLIE